MTASFPPPSAARPERRVLAPNLRAGRYKAPRADLTLGARLGHTRPRRLGIGADKTVTVLDRQERATSRQRLRVVMFTTFYPPYNFGGDGIGIQRLARALARRDFDVTVVHDADAYLTLAKRAPALVPADDGVTVVSLKSPLGAWSNLITHQLGRPIAHDQAIRTLTAPDRADIIWFHNVSLVGGPGLLAYGAGLKIYEAHEHWLVCPTHVLWRDNKETCDARRCLSCVLSYKRPPQLWRMSGMLAREARHVDAFIAKSAFSRDKHREFGFEQPMQVVPYFLPDASEAPMASGPAHDKPYFLFVGRLEKIKGVQDVIPAFAGEDGPDLLVIGDGEYAASLREQAAHYPRVKFLGRKAPEELGRYNRDALALITPSLCYETFGIVLIEAFRRGLPVIARRLGPFPEIVDTSKAGLLFETPEDLRAAMQALSQDQALRARMSAGAFASFAEHWSESAVMARYLDVVRVAAEKRGLTHILDALNQREYA